MKPLMLAWVVVITGCAAPMALVAEPSSSRAQVAQAPSLLDRTCAQTDWSNFVSVSSVMLPKARHDQSLTSTRPVTAREFARLQDDDCSLYAVYQREQDPRVRQDVLGLKDEMIRVHAKAMLATFSGQPEDARAFFRRREVLDVHLAAFKARVRETRSDVTWACDASR